LCYIQNSFLGRLKVFYEVLQKEFKVVIYFNAVHSVRLCLKCDGTRTETSFCLLTKQTSPFKSAGVSVHAATGRRAVHISLQGLYCSCKPVFCSHVMLTGYPLHSFVSPSLLLLCITVCHHISTGLCQFLIEESGN
jgi:hypothetical protein